jgi:hypothetical protein
MNVKICLVPVRLCYDWSASMPQPMYRGLWIFFYLHYIPSSELFLCLKFLLYLLLIPRVAGSRSSNNQGMPRRIFTGIIRNSWWFFPQVCRHTASILQIHTSSWGNINQDEEKLDLQCSSMPAGLQQQSCGIQVSTNNLLKLLIIVLKCIWAWYCHVALWTPKLVNIHHSNIYTLFGQAISNNQ